MLQEPSKHIICLQQEGRRHHILSPVSTDPDSDEEYQHQLVLQIAYADRLKLLKEDYLQGKIYSRERLI